MTQASLQSSQQRRKFSKQRKKGPMWPFFTKGLEIPAASFDRRTDEPCLPLSSHRMNCNGTVCRCCNGVPLRCNHSAWHINFIAVEKRIHHFCGVLSNSRYMWTYITLIIKVALVPNQGNKERECQDWPVSTRDNTRRCTVFGGGGGGGGFLRPLTDWSLNKLLEHHH